MNFTCTHKIEAYTRKDSLVYMTVLSMSRYLKKTHQFLQVVHYIISMYHWSFEVRSGLMDMWFVIQALFDFKFSNVHSTSCNVHSRSCRKKRLNKIWVANRELPERLTGITCPQTLANQRTASSAWIPRLTNQTREIYKTTTNQNERKWRKW